MGELVEFKPRHATDNGFEFSARVEFKNDMWVFHVPSCFQMDSVGEFLKTVQQAIEVGGNIHIRCEGRCLCGEHNP